MIDWSLARRVARLASGPPPPTVRLPGDLAAMAADAERRVVAYTRLVPPAALPAPEAIDRAMWAEINLRGMRAILDPVAERLMGRGKRRGPLDGPLRNLSGAILAAEVGGLTGLLAQRVLGQYELVLLDPRSDTRLLFLAPNLLDAARRLDVDAEQLVAWVGFHEVTHAVQFTAVPWLREHMAGLLRDMLETVEMKLDMATLIKGVPTSREGIETLVESVRSDGIVGLVVTGERKEQLDRIQATMAVIEGHAEHVMDAVGRDALPDLDALRAALDKRRADRSGTWRILEKLLGLEMKMRQYEVGKRFCDAVVEAEGVERLHTVFGSPDALPTWGELQDPPAWLHRTAA